MRTFREFITLCEQTYDKEMGQTVKKIGTGVKVGAERKKTAPERRRMKAAGGGKMVPAKEYKARKDIGQQRKAETRVQQPTKERGTAGLSPREQQRKAAMERRARKAGAKTPTASQLLAKKTKPKVSPDYKPQKASGMTRDERHRLRNAARRLMSDMRKGKEKPASAYDPQIKNFGKMTGSSAYSNTGVVSKGRKKGS